MILNNNRTAYEQNNKKYNPSLYEEWIFSAANQADVDLK